MSCVSPQWPQKLSTLILRFYHIRNSSCLLIVKSRVNFGLRFFQLLGVALATSCDSACSSFMSFVFSYLGGYHFLRNGVPNLKKVGVNEIATLPSPIHLTPKQVEIVLKSVFSNKINTLSVIILCLVTPYILFIKNGMNPLFFFLKIYDTLVYLGPLLPEKMIAPLRGYCTVCTHN